MAVIYPPALRLSPDHTTDAFFGDAARLQRAVDAERGKATRGEADDDGDE